MDYPLVRSIILLLISGVQFPLFIAVMCFGQLTALLELEAILVNGLLQNGALETAGGVF